MTQFQKTRIAYVNHTGQVSGAERVLLDMLQGLNRAHYEPYVLCPINGELSRLVAKQDVPCIPTPYLEARFTKHFVRLIRYAMSFSRATVAIRKAIISINPDIIHANTLRAGITATLATIGSRRNVIWHVHDILPQHPLTTGIRLFAYLSKRTQIVAVSYSAARAFCGSLSFKNRVRTIYNGTDLGRFPHKRLGSSQFRRQAGIPNEAFLVCAVGQICARKGLLQLITAFSDIYMQVPEMHIAIVGKVVFSHEEAYRSQLLQTVSELKIGNRVHFTGERHDISAVLQAADLLVLNSFEEPFGLVLIEAMSSGTPVLATCVGGIPEIVRDAENGWLIESGDTEGLASKLLALIRDREMLAESAEVALKYTCPRFSLEWFYNNLERMYVECGFQKRQMLNARYHAVQNGYSYYQGDYHA
jgi:glycosyltransferase involved in cell wall biosynthesis